MRISDWSSDVCSSDLITLPALAGVFLLYAVYGNLLPENISHRGYPWGRVLTDLYSQDGMFGLVLNVTATYVVLFVVFGVLLNRFGAGDFFVRLPFALTVGFRGGHAKSAVLGVSEGGRAGAG